MRRYDDENDGERVGLCRGQREINSMWNFTRIGWKSLRINWLINGCEYVCVSHDTTDILLLLNYNIIYRYIQHNYEYGEKNVSLQRM